jgi:hypothetical protein
VRFEGGALLWACTETERHAAQRAEEEFFSLHVKGTESQEKKEQKREQKKGSKEEKRGKKPHSHLFVSSADQKP